MRSSEHAHLHGSIRRGIVECAKLWQRRRQRHARGRLLPDRETRNELFRHGWYRVHWPVPDDNLLKRKGTVHVLVRKASMKKFDAVVKQRGWDPKRVVAVAGDMTTANCGVSAVQLRALAGKIQHFFHLAAIYDVTASAESQQAANVDGTQHALDLGVALKVKCFHHTSSIAAAGLYPGVFREDMFDRAEGLDDPYLRTKHASEGLVRASVSSGGSIARAWW